jgi:hypothetical protein
MAPVLAGLVVVLWLGVAFLAASPASAAARLSEADRAAQRRHLGTRYRYESMFWDAGWRRERRPI